MKRRWTCADDALLASMIAAGWSDARSAAALARTPHAVKQRRLKLGVSAPAASPWEAMTRAERAKEVGRRRAAGESYGSIGDALGTSGGAIAAFAHREGVAYGLVETHAETGVPSALNVRVRELRVPHGWTRQEIVTLARMRAEGESYGAIAGVIGRTRNACIGVGRRLGIDALVSCAAAHGAKSPARPPRARRAAPSSPTPLRKAAETPARLPVDATPTLASCGEHPIEPIVRLAREPVARPDGRVPIGEARHGQCRWVDDPDDGLCCGARVVPGKSWCSIHYARVFWRPSAGRDPEGEAELVAGAIDGPAERFAA